MKPRGATYPFMNIEIGNVARYTKNDIAKYFLNSFLKLKVLIIKITDVARNVKMNDKEVTEYGFHIKMIIIVKERSDRAENLFLNNFLFA